MNYIEFKLRKQGIYYDFYFFNIKYFLHYFLLINNNNNKVNH